VSKRTHPLDRDGDGKPGGSLPGNATAPFAGATDPAADQATDPAPGDKPADDADTAPADKAPTIAKAVKADQAMREADARAKAKAGAKVQIADDLLVRFGGAERHYLTEDGYSPSYRAPFISEDDAKALIDAGLAESVPSMGWRGGIRPTPAGRLAVHRAARRAQQHRDALRRAD
jgi:hypothetical protein